MRIMYLNFIFRLGLVGVFFINGISKLQNLEGVKFWMESYNFPGVFIYPAIVIEIVAPILILFNLERRFSYYSLMAFCFLSALVFHSSVSDPTQLTAFLKNIALMSGIYFLMVAETKDKNL